MLDTLMVNAIASISEAMEKFNLEIYDIDSYSAVLICEGLIQYKYKVEIELCLDGDYMVRINNGQVHTEIPLDLLNDYIITTIENEHK